MLHELAQGGPRRTLAWLPPQRAVLAEVFDEHELLRIERRDGSTQWMPESLDIVRYLKERFGG